MTGVWTPQTVWIGSSLSEDGMPYGSDHRKHWILLCSATAGIAVLGLFWSRFGTGDSQPMAAGESTVSLPAEHASPAATSTARTLNPDETLKAQFLGIWQHSENGEQWIENRANGTARMLLKLDFISSLLYGQQTHLDLTWDVKDGVLSHIVVGGTPVVNMNKIVKDFGKSRHYTILETTPQRMLLQSMSDQQKDLWTRVPAPKEWAARTSDQ